MLAVVLPLEREHILESKARRLERNIVRAEIDSRLGIVPLEIVIFA